MGEISGFGGVDARGGHTYISGSAAFGFTERSRKIGGGKNKSKNLEEELFEDDGNGVGRPTAQFCELEGCRRRGCAKHVEVLVSLDLFSFSFGFEYARRVV